MRFEYRPVASMPLLSWCARLREGDGRIEVMHGPWVETGEWGFFEGAWDGPFTAKGFAESKACFGTGARLTAEGPEFVGTTSPYRALLSLRRGDELFVSNSLPFLFARAGDRPELRYPGYYAALFRCFTAGFAAFPGWLPTAGGHGIRVYVFADLLVGPRLEERAREKRSPPAPQGFREYRDLLVGSLVRLRENACDPARTARFRAATTISRGYDSTACAALGASAGWKEAVTLVPDGLGFAADDGTAVAERLGLSVTGYGMEEWRKFPCPEAEFAATAGGGLMARLLPMGEKLSGSLLLVGVMGERVWDPTMPGAGPGMRRPGNRMLSAESLWEFQLRTGIVMVYPAVVAAVHSEALRRITTSPALSPWSVGGGYDRPIPRRIVEEAGVPRDWFGQRKMASSHIHLARGGSESSRQDFARFLAESFPGMPVPRVPPAALGAGNFPDWLRYDPPHQFHWATERTMRRYVVTA